MMMMDRRGYYNHIEGHQHRCSYPGPLFLQLSWL